MSVLPRRPPPEREALIKSATAHLERLIGFDTTSRGPNLALIDYAEAVLKPLGAACLRVPSADSAKANLIAALGPRREGGVVLSGHTDVVPVDGQPWSSDPFRLEQRGSRLYGRGTCDMKGFLALALAIAPDLAGAPLARPVILAFSYDEEIGCLGAPGLIDALLTSWPRPGLVVVGEPTNMQTVGGHKGISVRRVSVRGHEAHSSLTNQGVSAVMAAMRLGGVLGALAEALEADADPSSPFSPPHATLTIGAISGGTAANILARDCSFVFDLRCPPGRSAKEILAPFDEAATRLDAELKARFPEAGVKIEILADAPGLEARADSPADLFVRRLTGDNGPSRAVSYAAEAGQFQAAGLPTVICGPGSIEQAHQADEYLETEQLARGADFMTRLLEAARDG
jgi:acetylornithine deacetylase